MRLFLLSSVLASSSAASIHRRQSNPASFEQNAPMRRNLRPEHTMIDDSMTDDDTSKHHKRYYGPKPGKKKENNGSTSKGKETNDKKKNKEDELDASVGREQVTSSTPPGVLLDEIHDVTDSSSKGGDEKKDDPLDALPHVNSAIFTHFKKFQGWVDLPLEAGLNSNDLELLLADGEAVDGDQTTDPLENELNGSLQSNTIEFANNRFCGTTFDNAVDTHCHSPISCQFQRCPDKLTCYVLSEGVMQWCSDNVDTEDDNDANEEANDDELLQNEMEVTEKPLSTEMPSGSSTVTTPPISSNPTMRPTSETPVPSLSPTAEPSYTPTWTPTITPTAGPTSLAPVTAKPSKAPTSNPTLKETEVPSEQPSNSPITPTEIPTFTPTWTPTLTPSNGPTTLSPVTVPPTAKPSNAPTSAPTPEPSKIPTSEPTVKPSTEPTAIPSAIPSPAPADAPTIQPSAMPTSEPTVKPSAESTTTPSVTSESPAKSKPSKPPKTDSPVLIFTSSQVIETDDGAPSTHHPSNSPVVSPSVSPSIASVSASPSNAQPVPPTTSVPSELSSTTPSEHSSELPSVAVSNAPSYASSSVPSELSSTTPSEHSSELPSVAVSNAPSYRASSTSPVDPTHQPTGSQSTNSPSQEATIIMGNSDLTPSKADTTMSPSTTFHPNDKFNKSSEPTSKITPAPTFLLSTPEPTTQLQSSQPTKSKETNTVAFPKLKYVLLTTQGDLSEDAVQNVEIAFQSFLSDELAAYYEDNFASLTIDVAEYQSVTRYIDLRRRRLSEDTGTQFLFHGDIDFVGEVPTESEITEALVNIGEDSNEYLVSNITTTGDRELLDVVVVLVETSVPTSSPSMWTEEFARTPDAIEEIETEPPTEARTSIIIVSICGIAALTMLLFVFATRTRVPEDESVERNAVPVKSPRTSPHILPDEIDIESAQASYAKTAHEENETDSGYYLNDNEVSTIVSSVTDWNDYTTVDSRRRKTSRVEVVNGSRSHEDIVATWTDGERKTAAELNSLGTRTIEMNDGSVIPKTWKTSEQHVPARLSLGATLPFARSAEESDSDECSTGHGGFFPGLIGSFPSATKAYVDSRELNNCGKNCGMDAIYNDLDSSIDYSAESIYDWSHIGTVDAPSTAQKGTGQAAPDSPVPVIQKTLSEDSKDTSSLNRFISDLVWLEKKITDETDAAKVREAVELTLKESDKDADADSYSYQCDSFSPRSHSSIEEDATTISSRQISQPMSIVCRDCYVPVGEFKIDIVSTVDGPMINSVDEELLGHLGKGDLIIAVDDIDTRTLSAGDVDIMIVSKSNLERKLTVLQFGGNTSMC